MPFAFNFAARSDVGLVRSGNQDSGYAGPHLLVVADGMGGHAGGDIASSIAVGGLVTLDDDSPGSSEAAARLETLLHRANAEIGETMGRRPELQGMGTTATVILRSRNRLTVAHIGDSRAYLLRDGRLSQLTKDHSFVQTLVDDGRITEAEAEVHPQRSLVTRVLTGQADDEPDIQVREGRVGDRYLLCSDGLSGVVERDTVEEVLAAGEAPGPTAERLVELALRSGAPDNVTVIIGDLVDMTRTGIPAIEPQVVGSAAKRRRGTRATPTSPAAKAAALTRGSPTAEDDDLELADSGPRSRTGRILRVLAGVLAACLVIGAAAFALYDWTQKQHYVASDRGWVTVYRGVDQDVLGIQLHHVERRTDIRLDDLPDFYRTRIEAHQEVADDAAVDRLLATLQAQSDACTARKARGQACGITGGDSFTTASPSTTSPSTSSPTSPSPTTSSPTSTTATPTTPGPTTALTTGATP